ncbi:MAG: ribosomal L7Ae/L30e/S12e/Gadd45 family protein [Clostridiales bacterium]|jgi:ribosomal protein L7Ae-like RNA K-turn-binding protein|nr:ribosomal L7Ae/L30e/S12e/Gadd45 family protein [Clostridiales bacterium]
MSSCYDLLKNASLLVGCKQVERGIVRGVFRCVVVASDTDEHIRSRIAALCAKHQAEFVDGPSMRELGCLCGIKVGASAAGVLK